MNIIEKLENTKMNTEENKQRLLSRHLEVTLCICRHFI